MRPSLAIAAVLVIAAAASPLGAQQPPTPQNIQVELRNSTYRIAPGGTSGSFRTGQDADIMLSGIDFNRTGGGLLFNHPGGIASDGTRLLLADRNNNRILIWNTPPGPSDEPDIVLGQGNFETNNPGTGRSQLNWPSAVSAAPNGRLAVADTYNDRILLWNRFPASSGTPADIEIRLPPLTIPGAVQRYGWPWGVWTDGVRLVVTATSGPAILFWNQFPVSDDQRPDFVLTDPAFGTPRAITSDGNYMIVDDHNANLPQPSPGPLVQQHTGTFFWKKFPKSPADRYDFGIAGARLRGGTVDGKLVLLGWTTMQIWDHFPVDENDKAQITAGGPWSSDGEGIAVAGGTIYTFDGNWNSILAYRRLPDRSDARPDFAVGAPDTGTNTLQTRFFITTPIPVSNGQSLFVASGFDRKLHVWRQLPDESGALPDVVYSLPTEPTAVAMHNGVLVLAGRQTVYIWNHPPLNGEMPDRILQGAIGGAQVGEWYGVALDDQYFYLSDNQLGKVYVWSGIPGQNSEPVAVINAGSQPTRISSDGRFLAVPVWGPPPRVYLYDVTRLPSNTNPVGFIDRPGLLHLPGGALLADRKLFVLDTVFSRTLIWLKVDSAIAGLDPDIILGAASLDEGTPEIGQNKQFWPAGACFDGNYLWVGEYKFSQRLLRYSPIPSTRVSRQSFALTDRAGLSLISSGAGPVVSGHARIQPESGSVAPAGVAIYAFRQNGILVSEVSVPATSAMTSGRISAEILGSVNAGLAIVNPNEAAAIISFYFTDTSGTPSGSGFTTVSACQQIAQFLDQPPFRVYSGTSFQGTFSFTSSLPVAVVALRGFTNERGEFLMSVLPVVDPSSPPGRGTVTVPHFASGGGWNTQVLLINPTDSVLTGSIQFADQMGNAVNVTIENQMKSTFAYLLPARTSRKLVTQGTGSATISGSIRIVPAGGGAVPTPLITFSYKPGAITVSEAGVPVTKGTAFRMGVESFGASGQPGSVRSAVAIANSSAVSAGVMLELTGLDGRSVAGATPVSIPLAAGQQTARFIDQLFPSLPNTFTGILRIASTAAEISVVGLRTRVNERNDFLITTTSPAVETATGTTGPLFFPQVADGGGYKTQFIIFSATASRAASGNLILAKQDGAPFFLTLGTESNAPPPVPFNELVNRLMTGQLSESDKEAFRRLVDDMKSGRIQGPWFDEVRLATSNDGLNFTDAYRTVLRKASVPEAVVAADGSVWLLYVDVDLDKLLRAISEGTPMKSGLIGIGGLGAARSSNGFDFEVVPMEIANVVAGEVVDPDVVVAADGTYQLYYLGIPALELNPQTPDPASAPGAHRFYLAESRDLVHWEQKSVAWTGPFGGADPAVYRLNDGTYHIIAGGTGKSVDGGRTFQPFNFVTGTWGQPDVIAVAGGFRCFYGSMNGIRSSFSSDGTNWREEEGIRFREGADPTVVRLKNGTYHLYYKVRTASGS